MRYSGLLMVGLFVWQTAISVPTLVWAQASPEAAQVAAALQSDVHTIVIDLAAQRDAIGGWPTRIGDVYANLVALEAQLANAQSAGDAVLFRRRYRACMLVAARITRWLAYQYSPDSDQVAARDKVPAIVARLSERVTVLTNVARQVGVEPVLTQVSTARAQVDAALANGYGRSASQRSAFTARGCR
ncbi:MAG: hypothetical protein RL701_2469 [Pseudomonadota bacterium]